MTNEWDAAQSGLVLQWCEILLEDAPPDAIRTDMLQRMRQAHADGEYDRAVKLAVAIIDEISDRLAKRATQ